MYLGLQAPMKLPDRFCALARATTNNLLKKHTVLLLPVRAVLGARRHWPISLISSKQAIKRPNKRLRQTLILRFNLDRSCHEHISYPLPGL